MGKKVSSEVRAFFADMGRVGGAKSKRKLTAADARRMVEIREKKKAINEKKKSGRRRKAVLAGAEA